MNTTNHNRLAALTTGLTHRFKALTRTLNVISTTILLTLVFIIIVTPVALIRRLTGADPLKLREFKKSRQSALTTRNHTYTANDLKQLF
jgi:hypothetical protein